MATKLGYVICRAESRNKPTELLTRSIFATKKKAEDWLYDWLAGSPANKYVILRADDPRIPYSEQSYYERLKGYKGNPGNAKTGWIPAHAVRIRKVKGKTLIDVMR